MTQMLPNQWYWIRKRDGSLAPHLFHRECDSQAERFPQGEFFVGSMIVRFPLSAVVGPAEMPEFGSPD